MTEPFKLFLRSRQRFEFMTKEVLHQKKVRIQDFVEVLEPHAQRLANLGALTQIFAQYLILFDGNSDREILFVDKLSDLIITSVRKREVYNIPQVQELLSFTLSCLKIRQEKDEPIQIHRNLFLIFEKVTKKKRPVSTRAAKLLRSKRGWTPPALRSPPLGVKSLSLHST